MLEVLEIAISAAEREDWLSVTRSLQTLPLANRTLAGTLADSEWQTARQLALSVLCQGDFQQKWEIVKILSKLGDAVVPNLIAILEDSSTNLDSRWFTARLLSEWPRPDCILALANLLQKTQEEDLALIASQSLAQLGIPAIAVLNQLLAVPDSRLLSVRALAQIRRPETITPLLQVVQDTDVSVRTAAIEALGSFHDKRILPVLVTAMKDQASNVRREAIAALGRRHLTQLPANFAHQLQTLLHDLDESVCQQAAVALGRLGTEEAATILFPVFKSPATPMSLKQTLILALSWIETANALSYLEEGLRWSDPGLCREIIMALGRQERPSLVIQATKILQDFMDSGQNATSEPLVKQAIATALGDLGRREALATLEQLAADPNTSVRLHAIAALKKIRQFSIT